MDKIILKISHDSTNIDYKKILLRKFFCMVFIDANGKKLDFFIASVFGGIRTDRKSPDDPLPIVEAASTPCSLTFQFSTDYNDIKSFNSKDSTQSFWEQETFIERVWGNCEKLQTQKDICTKLREVYSEHYNIKEPHVNMESGWPVYFIEQGNKASHRFLATHGIFMPSDAKHKYEIAYRDNLGDNYDGLEVMNWIRTEITLSNSILNKTVCFSIEFEKDQVYTPDFTWYFAPPIGNIISESSYIKIGDKEYKNTIQGVADETTVLFNEWTSMPLAIEMRKKSRILFKSIPDVNTETLSKEGTLSALLSISSPKGPTNRQFLIGLLVAFLLAFCSDKTRINDYFTCLSMMCTCAENCSCQRLCNAISIVAPVLILLSFLSLTFSPSRCLPSNTKHVTKLIMIISRISGCIVTIFLVVYVFGFWLIVPDFLRKIAVTCTVNKVILFVCTCISILTNGAYFLYCALHLKLKVFNYL